MAWKEVTRVSLREEFVQLAMQSGANRRELCRRFKISPKTGYKWLRRYKAAGQDGLQDRSRRPYRSPSRTKEAIEHEVIRLRAESRNCWGGRKLARQLTNHGGPQLAPSTVTAILRRHGLIDPVYPVNYFCRRIDSRFLLPGRCRLPQVNCYPAAQLLRGGEGDGEATEHGDATRA